MGLLSGFPPSRLLSKEEIAETVDAIKKEQMALLKGFPPSNTISPTTYIPCEVCNQTRHGCVCPGGMTFDGKLYPIQYDTEIDIRDENKVVFSEMKNYTHLTGEPFPPNVEKILSEIAATDPWKADVVRVLLNNQARKIKELEKK